MRGQDVMTPFDDDDDGPPDLSYGVGSDSGRSCPARLPSDDDDNGEWSLLGQIVGID